MKPVRIFLSLLKNGEWDNSVYREIQALRDAWNTSLEKASWEICAIHIGYDRPEYDHVEMSEIILIQNKPVLMTEAAKWGLPAILSNCSLQSVGNCNILGKYQPCSLYLALDGWGYHNDGSQLPDVPSANVPQIYEMESWLKEFCSEHPVYLRSFQNAGIYDDSSYQKNLSRLDESLLVKAGNFRFDYFVVEKDEDDPFAILTICPEWLLNCPITRVGVTVRLKNVFDAEGIVVVRDITNFSAEKLLRIPNMGRKSMRDLAAVLLKTYSQFSANPNMLADGVEEVTLYDHLQKTLNELPESPKKIITARLGAGGTKPQTLQTLGEIFGVTRERIRQIEKKYINSIIERESWDDLIYKKIKALLAARTVPLYLDMLAAEDSWFNGFESELEYLAEVVTRFSEDKVKVISFEGRKIISSIDQNTFEILEKKIKDSVARHLHSDWTKNQVEELVSTECLGHGVPALRSLIWNTLQEKLHFAINAGKETLVGMGHGTDNLVSIVLEEAEKPLHYSEIHKRVVERAEKEIDIRRVHGCLTASPDAKLFDRGTYGLKRHLTIDSTSAEELNREVEKIVNNGIEFKQWHTSELLQILLDEENESAESLNHYKLGIILEESENLLFLGKQIWVSKHREGMSSNDRIQTMNAIITVLEDSGTPLKHNDLIEKVSKYRGLKPDNQINATEHLIKISPNLWGLANRDLPFSRDHKAEYLNTLYQHLKNTQKSIHISEIPSVLCDAGNDYDRDTNPFIFSCLCASDGRFKTWQGQLIGLAEWAEARRESASSAFRKVWPTLAGSLRAEEIQKRIETVLGRPLTRIQVAGLLCNSKASYDRESERWICADAEKNFTKITETFEPILEHQAVSSAHGG